MVLKMIEGHYKPGQTCLIVEEVVTSGSSELETVMDLYNESLITKEAVIHSNLESHDVQMKDLFTMPLLIEIFVKHEKITSVMAEKAKQYRKETKASKNGIDKTHGRSKLLFEEKAELSSNPVAHQLFKIMIQRQPVFVYLYT